MCGQQLGTCTLRCAVWCPPLLPALPPTTYPPQHQQRYWASSPWGLCALGALVLCLGHGKWLAPSAAPTALPSSGGQDPTLHPAFHAQNPVWMRTPTPPACQSTGTLLCLGSRKFMLQTTKCFSQALGGSDDSAVSLCGASSRGRQLLVLGARAGNCWSVGSCRGMVCLGERAIPAAGC